MKRLHAKLSSNEIYKESYDKRTEVMDNWPDLYPIAKKQLATRLLWFSTCWIQTHNKFIEGESYGEYFGHFQMKSS